MCKCALGHMLIATAQTSLPIYADQGPCCPLTESFDTVEYLDVRQRPVSDCATLLAAWGLYSSHRPQGLA